MKVGKAPASAAAASAPLELALQVERSVDGIGLRVINRGSGKVELAPDVVLEREQGGGDKTKAPRLTLRLDCKSQGCVSLLPGGELTAPSWLGSASSERCGELLERPGPGSYRLVVRSCDGKTQSQVSFVELARP